MKYFRIAMAVFALGALAATDRGSAQPRPEDSWGIHKIWGNDRLDELSFVRGGYVAAEWVDVNPAPGVFDFGVFDRRLAHYAKLGKTVTVFIRGSTKPDYMFEEIPYHPDRLSRQVNNMQGTLQYWHPQFRHRHEELLRAFRDYLGGSPYRSSVFSIRQTLNAVGTEHSGIGESERARSRWTVPQGVEFVPFTQSRSKSYQRWVTQTYYDLFASDYLVLVRSDLLVGDAEEIPGEVIEAINKGRVGLLHTTSMPQPESKSTARKYAIHKRYGRNGATPVYAEPFSSSTKGSRGEQPPAQWNYWRILSDLDAGVTYISVYGADLANAGNPEYEQAFEFGNRYAGYQTGDHAVHSPGAWIALREGGDHMPGDYSFLMKRMSGDTSDGLRAIGPESQRYGAWARRIPGGSRLRLEVDDRFARSASGQDMSLLVTYFDSRNPRFYVGVDGTEHQSIEGSATETWKTVRLPLGNVDFSGNAGADITLLAENDIIVHMVELVRNPVVDRKDRIAPDSPIELR